MLRAAWALLRDSGRIFLEAAPRGHRRRARSATRWSPSAACARSTTCTSGRSPPASRRCPPTCSWAPTTTATAAATRPRGRAARRFGIEHTTLQVDHEAGPAADRGRLSAAGKQRRRRPAARRARASPSPRAGGCAGARRRPARSSRRRRGSARSWQPSAAISAASSSSVRPASWRERPSQATANSRPSREAERGARVAAVGDVGVELGRAGAEALGDPSSRRKTGAPSRTSSGPACRRSPRGCGRQLVALRDPRRRRRCTCTQARTSPHGRVERHVPAGDAARAHLAQRRSRPAARRSRRPAPPRRPRAAHHGSRRAWPRSTATRSSVSPRRSGRHGPSCGRRRRARSARCGHGRRGAGGAAQRRRRPWIAEWSALSAVV